VPGAPEDFIPQTAPVRAGGDEPEQTHMKETAA